MIAHVASMIEQKIFFDKLTNEGVSAAELNGTRQQARSLANAISATPSEKIETLVAHYDEQLTNANQTFQASWQMNQLQGFRDAQIMIGFVASLLNKAGIRP